LNRIKTSLKEFLKENNSDLIEVKPNKWVYHKSNPIFREKISIEGLIPQRGDQWLSDTPIEGKAIFATNSDDPKEWFDSTWDDDVWKINTKGLKNKWYSDPNFNLEDNHILTFEPIPVEYIELIYKGSGDDLL
jgi:hypothetical protein